MTQRRPLRILGVGLAFAAAVLLSAGCGTSGRPATTVVDGTEVFVMYPNDCDDLGACAAGVVIDGDFYLLGCEELPRNARRGALVAVGSDDLAFAEARALGGEPPNDRLVAIPVSGYQACDQPGHSPVLERA